MLEVNSLLLEEIQKRYPEGIYSRKDFLERVKPGMQFETLSYNSATKMVSTGKNLFLRSVSKEKNTCSVNDNTGKISPKNIDDFFTPPIAIFLNEKDMRKYMKDINESKDLLWNS